MIRREVIGPAGCPILHRWTLFGEGRPVKLMIHHFLPNADDRDVHDHPRGFLTLVLRGYYDDMKSCPRCDGFGMTRTVGAPPATWVFDFRCWDCHGTGVVLNERMRAGMLRRRPATHRHRTKVGPHGCWTIVLMGPLRREWGFWRVGRWMPEKEYAAQFGDGMRCE